MKSFKHQLQQKLKDERFRRIYEEERRLAELSLKVLDARENKGMSQHAVAQKAKVTQQQLSKIENGFNCNLTTFLRVCKALGLKVQITA